MSGDVWKNGGYFLDPDYLPCAVLSVQMNGLLWGWGVNSFGTAVTMRGKWWWHSMLLQTDFAVETCMDTETHIHAQAQAWLPPFVVARRSVTTRRGSATETSNNHPLHHQMSPCPTSPFPFALFPIRGWGSRRSNTLLLIVSKAGRTFKCA